MFKKSVQILIAVCVLAGAVAGAGAAGRYKRDGYKCI